MEKKNCFVKTAFQKLCSNLLFPTQYKSVHFSIVSSTLGFLLSFGWFNNLIRKLEVVTIKTRVGRAYGV